MTDFQFWLLSTFSVFLCNILSLSRFIPKRTKVVDAADHIDITYHFCPKWTKSVEIATIYVKTTISVAVADHFCSIWTKSVDEQNRCLQSSLIWPDLSVWLLTSWKLKHEESNLPFELHHEKTCFSISEQQRYRSACTSIHVVLSASLLVFVCIEQHLSRDLRKPTFWFPTWSDTNQAVQLQKMAWGLKFWI